MRPRSQVIAAQWVAAAPGGLLHIGSSPMEGIVFDAAARISTRRRSQRGSLDFYHGLLGEARFIQYDADVRTIFRPKIGVQRFSLEPGY